ncbi:MAG: hypothetical protein JWM62_1045 [Frankiales bacterium]|nr:hypothetical protein [Frankiales bacterium]
MTPDAGSSAAAEVVLHQERVHVDTAREAVRAVVRRRIVTEVRTIEVTVRREVLEVEHLPAEGPALPVASEPRRALSWVLSEEVPVVQLEVRPYERVTVDVHAVAGEERVTTTPGEERVQLTTTFPV